MHNFPKGKLVVIACRGMWRDKEMEGKGAILEKFSLMVLAGLLFGADLALAQVAGPSLAPGFTSENPAVIQWSSSSNVGVGFVRSESEITNGGVVVDSSDSDGNGAGFRLVGENFSLAADMFSIDDEDSSGTKADFDGQAVNGAFRLNHTWAFGLGLRRETAKSGNLEVNSSVLLAGVSRRGAIFFGGATFGREKAELTINAPPEISDEVERDVGKFGIGIFNNEGVKWRVEYTEGFANFVQATGPLPFFTLNEEETTNLEIEVNVNGYQFGIFVSRFEETDKSVSPAAVVEGDAIGVEVGWVPEKGLAVVLSAQRAEETAGTFVVEDERYEILLSYLF